MKRSLLTIVVCSLLLTASLAIDLPNCRTSDFFKVLPLIPEEAYIINLNSIFAGYNLQFNATVDPDLQKYVKVGHKITHLNESFPDVPFLGLKSYHLSRQGNSWGPQFIALTQRGDRTLVHFGILSDNSSVPVINNYVNVQNMTNTTCFDAIQLPANNLIIVDCAQKRTANNSKGQLYNNIFYYFRISDGSKVKQLRTQMYTPFQEQKRRRLEIFSNVLSKHTFLFRTYFAQGINTSAKDNTYIQILMMQDPLKPWIVGLIDRTFLGVPRLWIQQVIVYLDSIYILDQLKGVHRVYISGSEDILYKGCYEAKGFTKLAVFSPNLDNHIELAIANTHAVHEVDWTDIDDPRLLNKYSLMPDSEVKQVFLNDRFVFVRSKSYDGNNIYNYTWTFTRGDRTFTRAFAVMSHKDTSTFVDFNSQLSYLMVVAQQSITNYAYDDPSFVLKLGQNQALMDTIRAFTLTASSQDPNVQGQVNCSIQINFTLLEENNRTMWAVGGAPPSSFTANYPGMVKLELGQYILGPNVTYQVREAQKGQLKKAKVYQLEQLTVSWENTPPFQNITFLQTETFSGKTNDSLQIYTQDYMNRTFISMCHPHHQLTDVVCNLVQTRKLGGQISNWATSMVLQPFTQEKHHILAYTTDQYYNQIFLEDLSNGKQVDTIILQNGFPGNLSSVTITGKYMFGVLRHIKRVDIYSLEQCLDDNCFPICNLNHMNMFKLGVRYFAPRVVHASSHHPNLLFVKTDDSIIVVDLSKECVPKVLANVKIVQSVLTKFIFEVNANYLVVTTLPGKVQEYDLSRIFLKEITLTKHYPLYGYRIPDDHEFSISQYGNCVYLSAMAEGGDYNVLVYRSGLPAIGSLYDQIDLLAFQKVLIDASGYRVDYVSVISGSQLRIFRQYEKPEIEIVNPDKDYQFYLEYKNTLDNASLELIDVSIINLPTNIVVNEEVKNIMNTKDLFYSGYSKINEVNDTNWFWGNVLYIDATCQDCPQKVRIVNHIELESRNYIAPDLTSYAYSPQGGQLLAQRSLMSLFHNGSVHQTVVFDATTKRQCLEVTIGGNLSVVGCKEDDEVYLQTVSWVGNKPFAFEPLLTSAINILKIQATNELVMLVDTDDNCYRKSRKGGIFLFEVSGDLDSDESLTQLEYIDGQDFGMRQLGDLYFNNAELVYNSDRQVYFLYATQMTRGLLLMQFSHTFGASDITIRRTYFVELKPLIEALNQTLPYDATFQGISLLNSQQRSDGKTILDRLLLTTGRYHTLQVLLTYDQNSNLISTIIERLYLRYSYYEVSNMIKEVDDLFIVQQSLPEEFENQGMNEHLYTVYSSLGPFNGTVQKRGLIGAFPLADQTFHRFDFNKSNRGGSQIGRSRVGMVIVEEQGDIIATSVHRNLTLVTTQLIDTQIVYLNLHNDFSLQTIRVLLNGIAPFPEWKLITIIIFSILGGILLIMIGLVVVKKIRQGGVMSEERDTLVTDESQM